MSDHAALVCVTLATALTALLAATPAAGQPGRAEDFIVPTREALLHGLDFTRPELAAVKEALDRGDVAAAGEAYVAHFRTRQITSPLIRDWAGTPRKAGYNTSGADGLLAGHFWDGYSVWEVPPTGMDWHGSPLSCMTRFPILSTLRWAYHNTRDPKYLRFIVEHILQYMHEYPIEEFIGKSTSQGWTNHTTVAKPWYWCMIPERLVELSQTLALIRTDTGVTADELLEMLHRLYQETGYLRTDIKSWVDRRHNGGGAMIQSMAEACAILEDFTAIADWLAYDAQLAAQYLDEAFYPDGMCVELTVAYSAEVAALGQRMAGALKDQPAIEARREKLANVITCLVGLSEPNGKLPSFGDLYADEVSRCIEGPLAEDLGIGWAADFAAGKPQAQAPFTEWPLPGQEQWCGYYTMRSAWAPDANYMAIDAGPWGTTHQHGDKLSFVVTAKGARFIIDPSSTRYASNEPDAFIGGQPSGFLHNTIAVDGVDEFKSEGTQAEATAPLANTWEQGDGYVLFRADYSFAPVKPVKWERRVVFADRSYWLLQDVITGDQPGARIEQNFQFEADIQVEFRDRVTVATAPNGARLLLIPLEGGLSPQLTVGDREPHVSYWPSGEPSDVLRREDGHDQKHGRGWTGRSGSKLIPAPAVTYVGDVAFPAAITLAIVPLGPEDAIDSAPQVSATRDGDATVWRLPVRDGALQVRTTVHDCWALSSAGLAPENPRRP